MKYRRKPYIAVILSLLEPGLGHIYCGMINRGLILVFVYFIVLPLASTTLAVRKSGVRMEIVIISIFLAVAMWIAVAADSYRTARRARPDYELKEYNRWYLYLILILMSQFGASKYNAKVKENTLEAFHIPVASYSMFPTLEPGDLLIANKIAYKSENPRRGDTLVIASPLEQGKDLVRRVVAIAGDIVEMRENELYINGEKLERTSIGRASYNDLKVKVEGELFTEKNGQAEYRIFVWAFAKFPELKADFPETVIPENHCFVLGDNRIGSQDSRHFGAISLAMIIGRADYLYWPAGDWSRFGKIK